MNAPQPTPTHLPVEPLSVRTQTVMAGILVLLGLCIGWRWWQDHYSARPAERLVDVTHRIDLNRAGRSELMQLPKVGPKLADNIVTHRQNNGPFKRVEDLKQVHGIGDATLDKIRPWVTIPDEPASESWHEETDQLTRKRDATTAGKRINVNKATATELETLPNIGKVLAQRIIEERAKKPFTSSADLRRVSGIGPKRIEAIKDVVTVED